MDELVERRVTNAGIDRMDAEKSAGVLTVPLKDAPSDKIQPRIDSPRGIEISVQDADRGIEQNSWVAHEPFASARDKADREPCWERRGLHTWLGSIYLAAVSLADFSGVT